MTRRPVQSCVTIRSTSVLPPPTSLSLILASHPDSHDKLGDRVDVGEVEEDPLHLPNALVTPVNTNEASLVRTNRIPVIIPIIPAIHGT